MQLNQHWDLKGKHAVLSASQHHWLNYTPEKMRKTYLNNLRKEEGTKLHAMASDLINHNMKMAKLKKAFNMFVNDAVGFKLKSEVVLFYSFFAFGTSDAIGFKDGVLRIHDLKTGTSEPSFLQLNIYAALFCLEYNQDPFEIDFVERLYQGTGFTEYIPTSEEIRDTMSKIVEMDKVITTLDRELADEGL